MESLYDRLADLRHLQCWNIAQSQSSPTPFADHPPCFMRRVFPLMNHSKAKTPCDQCFHRKVRCDYARPCQRCVKANLSCAYNVVRKKRGPKKGALKPTDPVPTPFTTETAHGSRALNHLSPVELLHRRLRTVASPSPPALATASGEPHAAPSTTIPFDGPAFGQQNSVQHAISFDQFAQTVLTGAPFVGSSDQDFQPPLAHSPDSAVIHSWRDAQPTPSERFERTSLIGRCVDLFFIHRYPTYPLISRSYVEASLNDANISKADKELIWAISALSLSTVDSWPDLTSEQRALTARGFIQQIRQSRVEWNLEFPCYNDVLVSLFIGVAFFEPRCKSASWFYVREAITLAQTLGLDKDETYTGLDHATAVRYRRAYALLFITERGSAVLHNTPVSILAPPSLEKVALADENPGICVGLTALHALFSLLDMKFVKLWNDPNHLAFNDTSSTDLSQLQLHLRELELDSDTIALSNIQRADVLITQQWLRLIFWHSSLKQGLVSSTAADSAFSYQYPIEIAMSLCEVVKTLPPAAIQVHGLGIFEKQFEIAYSLMDALSMSEDALPRQHECLRYLLVSLSLSPTSRQIYVKTLEKAMTGRHKYRSLNDVQLLLDESHSRQPSRRPSLIVGSR